MGLVQAITNEEIESIKSSLDEKEILEDNEIENLTKMKSKIGTDSIIFGRLFLICFDYFSNNIYLFKDCKDLNKLLAQFKDVDKLRNLFENYGDGEEYGSYYSGEKIKDVVVSSRKDMMYLIQVFFQTMGEEE